MSNLLKGWTFRRALYLVMGILVGIQAVQDHMWLLLIPAVWFGAMGVFAIGCAGPSCGIGEDHYKRINKQETPNP